MQSILRPMCAQFGALGGYGAEVLAQSIAASDADGFGAALASQLTRHD